LKDLLSNISPFFLLFLHTANPARTPYTLKVDGNPLSKQVSGSPHLEPGLHSLSVPVPVHRRRGIPARSRAASGIPNGWRATSLPGRTKAYIMGTT